MYQSKIMQIIMQNNNNKQISANFTGVKTCGYHYFFLIKILHTVIIHITLKAIFIAIFLYSTSIISISFIKFLLRVTMPKASKLTEFLKGPVKSFASSGMSFRCIAKKDRKI